VKAHLQLLPSRVFRYDDDDDDDDCWSRWDAPGTIYLFIHESVMQLRFTPSRVGTEELHTGDISKIRPSPNISKYPHNWSQYTCFDFTINAWLAKQGRRIIRKLDDPSIINWSLKWSNL
jgi:hypothetical protein